MVSNKILLAGIVLGLFLLQACSTQKKVSGHTGNRLLQDSALATAHIGISIYDPATRQYLYNYQGDKYFVPASNTKIPTCYLGMKYLGDSLTGLLYGIPEEKGYKDRFVAIRPTGDPTFLHPDFKQQPVFDFLRNTFTVQQKKPATFYFDGSNVERWGNGWSWNDYQEYYMAERNVFPVFGNVLNIKLVPVGKRVIVDSNYPYQPKLVLFETGSNFFNKILNNNLPTFKNWQTDTLPKLSLTRKINDNIFQTRSSEKPFSGAEMPFSTDYWGTVNSFLEDTLSIPFAHFLFSTERKDYYELDSKDADISHVTIKKWQPIHSQPTDSLLQRMMYRSDNFYAEQTLLMTSFALLDKMDSRKIIDTILKTDFKNLPHKPAWADGSGLSRYNLFTPQDFVHILSKMKEEFGMERIKTIFPAGGKGTLSSYYNDAATPYLYAKTGTLSGVVALSGFIYTKSGKELVFSVLVNNHQTSAVHVRRSVEAFLKNIREQY
ncbi:D-alanyl-D-alanine carboxypeptidase/D-alanyl-D-alanine-endopeptidase [Terrimonas rubra]|uniref:D-alanyl-D-alanine carboxypeptidase/D-alanyl-D-alanine-endopeptidase n=1 Tax=Terrimonas rubra TaxID=1035890 RepID=A0ABW6A2R9_9BACT